MPPCPKASLQGQVPRVISEARKQGQIPRVFRTQGQVPRVFREARAQGQVPRMFSPEVWYHPWVEFFFLSCFHFLLEGEMPTLPPLYPGCPPSGVEPESGPAPLPPGQSSGVRSTPPPGPPAAPLPEQASGLVSEEPTPSPATPASGRETRSGRHTLGLGRVCWIRNFCIFFCLIFFALYHCSLPLQEVQVFFFLIFLLYTRFSLPLQEVQVPATATSLPRGPRMTRGMMYVFGCLFFLAC